MDPFSITVGVVGLADTGTSLAGFLTDKYKAYRDAPELILEIAHEVEFCAGLVDMFGSSLDRPGVEYPKRFVKDAKGLVERTQVVFEEIRLLIPVDRDFDASSSRARWRFMLDKKKLTAHQQRLRQIQQMFMFMETMHRYHYPTTSTPGSGSNTGINNTGNGNTKDPNLTSSGQNHSFSGVLQYKLPANLTGVGAAGQTYQVTLTMNPMSGPLASASSASMGALPVQQYQDSFSVSPAASRPGWANSPVPEVISVPGPRAARSSLMRERGKQGMTRLEGLRRSPFFDISLLGEQTPPQRKVAKYSQSEGICYSMPENIISQRKQSYKEGIEDKDSAGFRWDAPDNTKAKRDVEELSKIWFGDNGSISDSDYDPYSDSASSQHSNEHDSELAIGGVEDGREATYGQRPNYSYGAPPGVTIEEPHPDLVPPQYTSINYSARAQSTVSPSPSNSTSQRPSGGSTATHNGPGRVECDGCDREIRPDAPRMRCRSCPVSYDLCAYCFADPDTTLRHRHPKSHFLRDSVER